ncbi:MAG: 2-C-methyl-D-erythritol 2,4-cyclodiphosphate synthase [Bacillota bacterium]|nr:2-C-methyl-D-erythritol 2,4-cyclodiphosphate synthase [Bacillota bacterium]MDD3297760.1 2-C-methyl-D-erythritol 2,4-cyclodiphosphate synthase [Bacillota bacterium]MDD3850095.1 2-C-methyl-D-erythritol 2,4-cyclodiphosphate synthase [Bacillota bacterium]MDD4706667.1 2-C-methyl-D-erythritol 2,4-cyclodiphosphate synthase [Bacillota bacterium]
MNRIGIGFDAHRLVEGRPLIIGGVKIPFKRGLIGHSDADVLVHAVMDALLGAAAMGDIGKHFPDENPAYLGADSLKLLKEVGSKLGGAGYIVGNIDGIIIAQRPRMAEYIPNMQENIARQLGIDPSWVSIKATTTEGMGFAGQEEGIAAQAVALLVAGQPGQ